MTEEELAALFVALKYSKDYQGGIKKFVEVVYLYGDKVLDIANEIIPSGNWTCKDVKNVYLIASKYQQLLNLIKKLETENIKFEINSVKELLSSTQTIIAIESINKLLILSAISGFLAHPPFTFNNSVCISTCCSIEFI